MHSSVFLALLHGRLAAKDLRLLLYRFLIMKSNSSLNRGTKNQAKNIDRNKFIQYIKQLI